MSQRVPAAGGVTLPGEVRRRRFSVEEYHRMGEASIIGEDDRVELIEGEVVEMTPIGPRHLSCVNRLNWLLMRDVGEGAIVSPQNPVRLSEHLEPQPDLAVITARDYSDSLPAVGDVLLVIEVADTSLSYDRQTKLPLYARAGIEEVWIVDLTAFRVELYTNPSTGAYQNVATFSPDGVVRSQSVPTLEIAVSEILPA